MKKAEQIKNQFRDASHMKDFNVAVNSLDSSFSRLEELLQDIRFSRSKLLTKLKDKSDVITKRYFSLLDNCSLFEEGWLAVYADFSEFATEWISFKNTKLKLNEKAATGDYNKHLKEVYGVDTVKNHLAFMNRWNNAVPEIQKLVLDIDTALDYILLEVRNNL
jgi:hypothetical protein